MKKIGKILLSVVIVFALVVTTNVFVTDAAKKIKSKSVSVDVKSATIAVGDVVTISAAMKPTNSTDSLKWSSSNNAVATVNKYGVVTGISEGSATITVKTSSKKKATCKIEVKKTLSEAEITTLIKNNMYSEEYIKQLIAANTLSEADVQEMITNSISGISSGSSSSTDDSWADGTELTIDACQTLPLTLQFRDGYTARIDSVSIKKYRINDWENDSSPNTLHQNSYYKYRYTISVSGYTDYPYSSRSIIAGNFKLEDAMGDIQENYYCSTRINSDGTFSISETWYSNEPICNTYLIGGVEVGEGL